MKRHYTEAYPDVCFLAHPEGKSFSNYWGTLNPAFISTQISTAIYQISYILIQHSKGSFFCWSCTWSYLWRVRLFLELFESLHVFPAHISSSFVIRNWLDVNKFQGIIAAIYHSIRTKKYHFLHLPLSSSLYKRIWSHSKKAIFIWFYNELHQFKYEENLNKNRSVIYELFTKKRSDYRGT